MAESFGSVGIDIGVWIWYSQKLFRVWVHANFVMMAEAGCLSGLAGLTGEIL